MPSDCGPSGFGVPRGVLRLALLAVGLLTFVQTVSAQPGDVPMGGGDAAFFQTESAAGRKLNAARELVLARKWRDALELIDQALASAGTGVVPVDAGRLASLRGAANLLLAAIPPEGLTTYRNRVDPQARRWFESGRDADLERILERALLSSFAERAAITLGDRALERGDPSHARSLWELLLPPHDEGQTPDGIPPIAYIPRAETDLALIRARLVLASLAENDLPRATQEAALFRKRHPAAAGRLMGQSGVLADLLDAEIAAAPPAVLRGPPAVATLGGNAARSDADAEPIDVGAIRWSTPLTPVQVTFQEAAAPNFLERPFAFPPQRGRANSSELVLATFPLLYDQAVFCCDETSILAYDLFSRNEARPLWGDSPILYSLPHQGPRRPVGNRVGLPAYTLSIAGELLFARLGRGVSVRGAAALLETPPSTLVCLDLGREGDLRWSLTADRLGNEVGNWVFDGAPLPYDGRLYVLLRKTTPQPTLFVACLQPETGTVLWNRPLCQGQEFFAGDYDEQHHLLLSAADGRVYCATQLGAVAALQSRTGDLTWVATYPRLEFDRVPELHDRQALGPSPCVCADGVVYVAPLDSNSVFAFDAASGVRLWERPLAGDARQILGVSHNRVIVAGSHLWGLHPETGALSWIVGRDSPEAKTRGRGVLAGRFVYWPRPEEILVVEAATGITRREISLAGQHQTPGGGNLVLGEGFLVCAQANRLLAFWEYPNRKLQLEQDLTRHPGAIAPALRLALHEEAQGEGPAATRAYEQVLANSATAPHWYGRPADKLARQRAAPLLLQQADSARSAGSFHDAARWYHLAADSSPIQEVRAQALAAEAGCWLKAGKVDRSADLVDALRDDPDLARLPVSPGESKTIFQTASIELARAREILRDRLDARLLRDTLERVQTALRAGRPAAVPMVLPEGPYSAELLRVIEKGAGMALSQGDRQTAQTLWHSVASHAADNGGRQQAQNQLAALEVGRPTSETAGSFEISTPDSASSSSEAPLVFGGVSSSCRWRAESGGAQRLFAPQAGAHGESPAWVLTTAGRGVCRRFDNGEFLWSVPLAEPVDWAGGNDSLVLLGDGSGLTARDARDGSLKWSQPAPQRQPGDAAPRYRVVRDLLLILQAPRELAALALHDGTIRWRFRPDHAGRSLAYREQQLVGDRPQWLYRPARGQLQPFWCERDGIIGLQTLHPRRTCFLDIDDGFARDLATPPGHDWIADPETEPTQAAWGVARCRHTLHELDGRTGQVTPLHPNQELDGIRPAYEPGDLPLPGTPRYLAFRDEIGVTVRQSTDGHLLWHQRLPGDRALRLDTSWILDAARIYISQGPVIRAYSLEGGQLEWEHLVETTSLSIALRLALAGDTLTVWSDDPGGRLSVECLDRHTGALLERWHLPGRPTTAPTLVADSSVLLLTDRVVARFHPPASAR